MIPKKINNDYAALMLHDFIDIKHPITKKIVRLYRLISTKTFKIDYQIIDNLKDIEKSEVIDIHTIGGYVESIDNLDSETNNWISNISKVFDKAIIKDGTIIKNSCTVYGNTEISGSRLSNYVRVSDNVKVTNSLITDLVEIKNNSIVNNSYIHNASMIMENGEINNTTMTIGSIVRGNAKAFNSQLGDVSQIQGDCEIHDCILLNRTVLSTGKYINETLSEDPELNVVKHVIEI